MRLTNGRFGTGNRGGPGNPHAATVAKLRATLLDATTPEELEAVWKALLERARNPRDKDQLKVAELVLTRLLGKPVELDVLARLDALDELLAAVTKRPHPSFTAS